MFGCVVPFKPFNQHKCNRWVGCPMRAPSWPWSWTLMEPQVWPANTLDVLKLKACNTKLNCWAPETNSKLAMLVKTHVLGIPGMDNSSSFPAPTVAILAAIKSSAASSHCAACAQVYAAELQVISSVATSNNWNINVVVGDWWRLLLLCWRWERLVAGFQPLLAVTRIELATIWQYGAGSKTHGGACLVGWTLRERTVNKLEYPQIT